MDMQGSRQLAVTQQQAWEALNDPEVLNVCIPGCDSIEATGEGAYALTNAIKVGPVSARFKGNLQLTDIQAPDSYTINFEGNGGAAGFGKGSAKVNLVPNDAGCELGYTVNASVGRRDRGRPGRGVVLPLGHRRRGAYRGIADGITGRRRSQPTGRHSPGRHRRRRWPCGCPTGCAPARRGGRGPARAPPGAAAGNT